ncbi:MAG: hypothetical protein ACXU8A_03330 [Burkholderiaceae bacterium]
MVLKNNTYITWMCNFLQKLASSRLASWLLLCSFFWIVAAASFAGFVGKWGLPDGAQRNGVEVMLDATAYKPFIYRQFAPMTANFLEHHIPERLKNFVRAKVKPENTFTKTKSVVNPEYQFRYICIYYLNFFALFLSLFVLRRILLDFGIGSVAAIVAPISFLLAFPYLQTIGGYFYDSLELFFISIAVLIATRGNIFLLIALALPATLNKETFFFVLPTLYPLLRHKLSPKMALTTIGLAILVSGIVNVLLKMAFIDAPGGAAEFHFFHNIRVYLMPWAYRQFEDTYGIVGPSGTFFGTIAVVAIIAFRSWPNCPKIVRQHLFIAAAINLPLFLLFCIDGELRNLSLLFVGFVILIGVTIDFGGKYAAQSS